MNNFPINTWVRCKNNGVLRYITKYTDRYRFEDDGKISGQAPSPHCHCKYYEPINSRIMKNRVWVTTIIDTDSEQRIHIEPTPEMEGAIVLCFEESDGVNYGLYLQEYEVEVLCKKMREMMEYIKYQNEYDTKREG